MDMLTLRKFCRVRRGARMNKRQRVALFVRTLDQMGTRRR